MADNSAIEWTDATWNPIVGCSILTPGCINCYAMKMAARIQKMNRTGGSNSNYVNHYDGTTKSVKGNAVWTGKLAMAPDKLFLKPLSRRAPTTYFVNSMGDLFHEDCPDEWIDKVFAVMALSPQHTFQVLTKRAERMRNYCSQDRWPFEDRIHRAIIAVTERQYPAHRDTYDQHIAAARQISNAPGGGCQPLLPLKNVWLGVSTEDQTRYDERKEYLRSTPAAVRFFSMEPLLGPIDADYLGDWVIVGGESGPGARPMHPAWARSLRDQCLAAGVPFFLKQWGEWVPQLGAIDLYEFGEVSRRRWVAWDGEKWDYWDRPAWCDDIGAPEDCLVKVGKKAAGRLLDGKLHDGMPAVRA
jgi:protein gp37